MKTKHVAWQEGFLLADADFLSNVELSRTDLLMAAHTNFDDTDLRLSILNDVEVVDQVDAVIRNMMKSSIRA